MCKDQGSTDTTHSIHAEPQCCSCHTRSYCPTGRAVPEGPSDCVSVDEQSLCLRSEMRSAEEHLGTEDYRSPMGGTWFLPLPRAHV